MIVHSYTRQRVEEILREKLQIDPNHRLFFDASGRVFVADSDTMNAVSGQDTTPIPSIAGSYDGINAQERTNNG